MKYLIAVILLLCTGLSLRAEPIKLTNRQADELLAACLSIDDGLSVVNTTILADNENELRPKVDAYSKGNLVAQRKHKIVSGVTKVDDPEYLAYVADIEANQEMLVTVDLTRFALTDEEVTTMKVRAGTSKPSIIAILRLYLKPKK